MVYTKSSAIKESRHLSHTVHNRWYKHLKVLFNIYFPCFCRPLILMKSCKTKKYEYKITTNSKNCKNSITKLKDLKYFQRDKLDHMLLIKKLVVNVKKIRLHTRSNDIHSFIIKWYFTAVHKEVTENELDLCESNPDTH